MSLNNDFVTEELNKQPFEIINMVPAGEDQNLVLTIIHELHPEVEATVTLISKTVDGEDTMEMQFDGSSEYTDTEAKQVLQNVMDTLVSIITKGLDEMPSVVPDPTITEDPTTNEGL